MVLMVFQEVLEFSKLLKNLTILILGLERMVELFTEKLNQEEETLLISLKLNVEVWKASYLLLRGYILMNRLKNINNCTGSKIKQPFESYSSNFI